MEGAYSSIAGCSVRVLLRAIFLPAIAAAIAPLLAGAQQQPAPSATFQVQVDFVDIDAVVTDERGNFVADLTKDDFELLDDGKPQEISAFSLVDIPVPAAGVSPRAVTTAVSDVKSNAEPISGRLYVIVLDDLNVAPLRTKVVIDAARELIERHFGPNDMAAITYTSGRTDGAQEFTSERAVLLAAINKFQGRKLRSTVIEKADQYFQQHLKELEVNQSEPGRSRRAIRAPTIGNGSRADAATRTSRPMPTTSSAAIARNRCWAR